MKIAQVIVDVPAKAINQTFDYKVPKKFAGVIQRGMRVVIPFGPRKITGFVMNLTDHSPFDSLKEIIDILDMTPVLTDELIELGKWMAEDTLCLYITAFQAMLPQALKSSYKKEIVREHKNSLPVEFEHLFNGRERIDFDEFTSSSLSYHQLQRLIQSEELTIRYFVQSKITKKYVTMISPAHDLTILKKELDQLSKQAMRQKQLLAFFIDHPVEIEQSQLINTLQTTQANIKTLIDKGLLKRTRVEVYRDPYEASQFEKTDHLQLTDEQEQALRPIKESILQERDDVFLLHGVTGSGKTEIYLQAIEQVINEGKEAIVLVPEISLTPQMVKRFKERFGSDVAVLHSGLSNGEKYDEWRKIQHHQVKVAVGARSAIFAPFKNLGIIVIDEEHETTYKQQDQPRYHARDIAIYRAKHHQCPVVLGSATPTLESYARAQKGVYRLLTLTNRTNQKAMPKVDIIDMREELHSGNRTMFSRQLKEKIEERIKKKEQIVLLLNRRGYSTFVMCRDCGHVKECPHCDIALTYHKNSHQLKCHYCSHEERVPAHCPECQSTTIRFFGTGTERVEEALLQLIPEASIIRMDVDTTRRKGAHERLLKKFANQEADILLGTQMIAKGLDFPNVTLVGVLTADSMLHLPDFRSSERTFQLLTQVSGRAGRHELPGEVIVQTYTPEHYSIELASQYNFIQFYNQEMKTRRAFQYPPYVFLALITVSHRQKIKAVQTTQKIVQMLLKEVSQQTKILGPTPSPLERIKDRYRYQCMIKYKHEPRLRDIIQRIMASFSNEIERDDLMILVDMQPYQLM